MASWLQAAPFILGGVQAGAQGLQTWRANRENEQRYQQMIGEATGLRDRMMGTVNPLVGQLQTGYEQAIGNMRGLGEAARTDLNQAYQNLEARNYGDLVSSGFGQGTAVPSMRMGVQRERQRDLNRLNESLRREQFGYDTFGLQQKERLGLLPLAYDESTTDRLINIIGQREDIAPNESAFLQSMQGLGLTAAPLPSVPEPDYLSTFGAPIAGGVAGGFTSGFSKWLFQVCIDGLSTVETKHGLKRLADIEPGDYVRGTDNVFHRVLEKDFGEPWEERKGDFVMIVLQERHLICTKDHIINGKPAGEWKAGEEMRTEGGMNTVEKVKPVEHVTCGDLKLEGCDEYYASGFLVQSMFNIAEAEKAATDGHSD